MESWEGMASKCGLSAQQEARIAEDHEGVFMLGKTHAWIGVFILVLITLLAVPNAKAQLTEGTLTGNVTDPSGAAVAGAKVTATNVGTQLTSETLTDSIGFYRLPHLPIGLYNLRFEKTGFKAGLAANVEVEVNVVSRAD